MCPACIANITLMAAGVTSGGGAAAFVFSRFYKSNNQIKTEDNQNEKTSRKEEGRGETFQNCVAERLEAMRQQLVVKEKKLTHSKNDCPEVIH